MTALFPAFDDVFRALHDNRDPYPWQTRLAQDISDTGWPTQIAIPTGLGKTSTLVHGIYELARQLHFETPLRTAPQRIVHIAERRTIVDTTAQYAERIAQQINAAQDPASAPALAPVHAALARLLGEGDKEVISVAGVHGRSADDRSTWRATGCTVVSLTAHQFVSRLLFRSFDESPKISPILAGLSGIDRLVLFDEPHLIEQAAHTILDAEQLQAEVSAALGLPSQTVFLGATVPESLTGDGSAVFRLDDADTKFPESRRRLGARRSARLRWTGDSEAEVRRELVAAAQQAQAAGAERVVVFVNTVAIAQGVAKDLAAAAQKRRDGVGQPHLLTSRFRPFDRNLGADDPIFRGPCTVVATQTLEVGVDITFDALVTEVSSWSAFVQRLGRLNRNGRSAHGSATIVCSKKASGEPSARKPSQAIYGADVLENVTTLLARAETGASAIGTIDLSPAGLASILDTPGLDRGMLDPPAPRIATLHRDMLPLIAQSFPTPETDFPLSSLISGPDASVAPEVRIAWRTDLTVFDQPDAPSVSPDEFVAIPMSALAGLLSGNSSLSSQFDDTGQVAIPPAAEKLRYLASTDSLRTHFRLWNRDGDSWSVPSDGRELRRAILIVAHPSVGGYSAELGWTGSASNTGTATGLDVSLLSTFDQIFDRFPDGTPGHRPSPRPGPGPDLVLSAGTLSAASSRRPCFASEEALTEIQSALSELGTASTDDADVIESARVAALTFAKSALAKAGVSLPAPFLEASRVTVQAGQSALIWIKFHSVSERDPAVASTQLLDDHEQQVASWARGDALAAGVPNGLAGCIGEAGMLHDEGKRNPRQQAAFSAPSPDTVVAKSVGTYRPEFLSRGYRHEAESFARAKDCLDSLALHLVITHHGFARPILPPVVGETPAGYPAPLAHADEFARLNDQFGPWGLAYLEAVLRLADWRASAAPSTATATATARPKRPHPAPLSDATVSPDADPAMTVLEGLLSHPLTGWFSAAGLLAAAVEAGDQDARLRWKTNNFTGAPSTPELRSTIPVDHLVELIVASPEWQDSQDLLLTHGIHPLGEKYQRLGPAKQVRPLLRDAATPRLLRGILSDLLPATDAGRLDISIPAFANNSSYPAVAIVQALASETERTRAVTEAIETLASLNAGYGIAKCDGGMDRSPDQQPAVNGLGDAEDRQARIRLAPLALFGMSRFGSGAPNGAGVGRRKLRLPLPSAAASLEQIRAAVFMGQGPKNWDWHEDSFAWEYIATQDAPTKYERTWLGGAEPRAASRRW